MAFARVSLDEEDLTANIGREQLDLFDTKCIAALYRDTDGAKRARIESEQVISASSPTHFALAVEGTLHVFAADGELGYVGTALFDNESILALKWLGDLGLLVVASNKAILSIYSVAAKKVVFKVAEWMERTKGQNEDQRTVWESCHLDDFYVPRIDGRALFISPNTGILYRVVFNAWETSFVRTNSASDPAAQLESLFTGSFSKISKLDMGDGRFEQMTAFSFSTVGGCCVDGLFRQVQQPLCGGELRVTVQRKELVPPYIRARLVNYGTILAVLTKEGTIVFIDLHSMMEVESYSLPRSSTESITDFAFLEWPDAVTDYEKIALIVQNGDRMEMQIREVDELGTVAYAREVVRGSFLIQLEGPSADADRLALVVEPADEKMGFADQRVSVRDVVETQPEQRLSRLIARGMLCEAERFAMENKLDVQLVHSARVAQLLQQLGDRPDDEVVFEGFLKAVEKVDRESKGDWVLGAIAPLRKAEWISRLLEYAEKKDVGEPAASSLASIAYTLATYQMIFGPNAQYGRVWEEFQYSPEWMKQWLKLLRIGNVGAARIIWHRYPREIQSEMSKFLVPDAIHATKEMLLECPHQWEVAIDHLEADVMFLALSNCQDTNEVYEKFIELLVLIATMLERKQPDGFPDNALYAVSAVERLVNRVKKGALTSLKAAEFISSSSGSVEIIEAMYKRSRDLRAIKRLKETYECPLSYEKYKKLSTKEICHEILQRSVQNPAQVRDRIDRIARPFMEEHSLPVDETLLGHIEKVTSIARCQSSSEPLDLHCLLVTDAINSVAIRARAVLKIADSAPIPWCPKLLAAVEQVMGDARVDQKIKDQLNLASDRMRLGAICQNFGLDRDYVDSAIDSYAAFAGFIRFLLSASLTSTREITDEGRYDIAAEAVAIYDRLRPGVRPTLESPRVDVREYVCMLVSKHELASLHKFVEKEDVIDETIEMLVMREETADYSFEGDKDWKDRRVSAIVAINSLIQRHRRGDERWKETYEEMRKMLTLVTKYDTDTSLVVLRTPGVGPRLLHRYMAREHRKLRDCLDLSSVLGLSHDETFLALLDYSAPLCPEKQRMREEDVDVKSALYLSWKAVEHAKTASTTLLLHIVYVAELAMKRTIPEDAQSPMTLEACESAAETIDYLTDILPAVLELDVDLMVTQRALAIHRAVRFIGETVRQMQQGQQSQSQSEGGTFSRRNSIDEAEEEAMDDEEAAREIRRKDAEANAAYTTAPNIPPLALSNRRRVGAYDASMDNPIMETGDMMRAVCSVGFMMWERPEWKNGGEEQMKVEEMEDRWVELFGVVDLFNQHMLELHARALYAVWDMGVSSRSACSSDKTQVILQPLATGSLAERLVQQHPCDLPLLATIFATLDDKTCMEALVGLVKIAKKGKSPQTMLNVCRLAQLMITRKERMLLLPIAGAGGNAAVMQTPAQRESAAPEMAKWKTFIKDNHDRAIWEKKLGKKKIVAHKDGAKAVSEFAANMLSPEIVREYLLGLPLSKLPWEQYATREISKDRHTGLIARGMAAYLTALLTNAVKAKDNFDRDGFLVIAENAIELELSQSVYEGEALRSFLCDELVDHLEGECCPYAHEVIQFVLAKLISLGGPNDERWKNGKKVADFICLIPREFSISAEERAWYTERRTAKNMEMESMGESMADELNFAQMPDKAATRLPFHLLLRTSEVELAKYVVPLVWHEITLPNLQDWYNLLRDVHMLKIVKDFSSQKLNLKRQMLITKAVMKYIKTAQEQNDQLSDLDMEWIQERLYAEKNVNSLLQTFAMETIKVAPQGNTRIQLMQLGYNVTKKYLNEQPETAPDRKKIEDQQKRLQESLREMNTRRLLQNHKIYNAETSPCVKDVDRLISRIYDRFINWDEPTDVQQKCALIQELANTNEHELEDTHFTIVESWLRGENGGGDDDEALPDVDMNDTMGSLSEFGGGGNDDGKTKGDDEDSLLIPFYDEEVTRIVHVVRLSKNKENLVKNLILNYVNMPSPPGGHPTHIRALSALLRACTAEELEAWAPLPVDEYACNLETRLNRRLVERSLGAAAYTQFDKAMEQPDKLQMFIRNLLMGTQRSKPGTVWLASVLTMDNYNEDDATPIADQKLVEHMLAKLQQDRKYALLAVFLKFCSSSSAFCNTRHINVLWGRTIENAMKELEDDSAPVSLLHEWLLFALSCPTQGNAALESLKRLMEKRGAPVGAYLVKLASSYTKSPMAPSPDAWKQPTRMDYPVMWVEGEEKKEEQKDMDTSSY